MSFHHMNGWEEHPMPENPETYRSQSARDAQERGYGGPSYWASLDAGALRSHDYYMRHGDPERAAHMLTRSLGEALAGNDGD